MKFRIPDAFCELEIYEELGLCEYGEAGKLIDEGVILRLMESIP